MKITINEKKIDELEDLAYRVYDGEEPLCIVCDFRCPFSTYKDGHYCKYEDPFPFCKKAFIQWLKE